MGVHHLYRQGLSVAEWAAMRPADRRQLWKEIEEEKRLAREEEDQRTSDGAAWRELKASKGSPTDLPGLPALAAVADSGYKHDFIKKSMDMRTFDI